MCTHSYTHRGGENQRQTPYQANRIIAEIEASNFIVHQRTGTFQRQILNASEYYMAEISMERKQKQ